MPEFARGFRLDERVAPERRGVWRAEAGAPRGQFCYETLRMGDARVEPSR